MSERMETDERNRLASHLGGLHFQRGRLKAQLAHVENEIAVLKSRLEIAARRHATEQERDDG